MALNPATRSLPPRVAPPRRDLLAERLEVFHRRAHAGDVLVDEGARLDLVGRLVGDEVLAEGRQALQRVVLAPQESHVRREGLVAGADEIVAVPGLHVDHAVRAVMDAVDEHLRAGGMRKPRRGGDVDDRADRMRGAGERDDARAVRKERLQVLGVERSVVAHPPPLNVAPRLLELQPGGDVGVVVHVGHDDLVPRAEASGRSRGSPGG